MTKELYNQSDVTHLREKLLVEQRYLDALTSLPIPDGQSVLDHNHDNMYVRGVLHRQVNAALGKIENIWVRFLSYWYPGDLKSFLRQAAAYLEKPNDTRYYHPKWIAKAKTSFNKLTAPQQRKLLESYELQTASNPAGRKEQFRKLLLTKTVGFDRMMSSIMEVSK